MDLNELVKKRPLSRVGEEEDENSSSKKRAKLTTLSKDESTKVEKDLLPVFLIERHRHSVTKSSEEIFAMFISQCLQRERSSAMEKIISKLKRRYEEIDGLYRESSEFKNLLNKKREALTVADKLLYTHISEIYDDMKNRKKRKQVNDKPSSSSQEPSTSNQAELNESIEDKEKEKHNEKKINKIILSMEKCKERILKYDQAEVDWDDDGNSHYIKAEKYKERIIQLHNKLCELTGERKDAKRSYLKPKHFKVTKIESVDQAINSFINKNLKNKTDNARSTDSVIFPDYVDILNCIKKCNEQENLSMSKEAMKSLGKLKYYSSI